MDGGHVFGRSFPFRFLSLLCVRDLELDFEFLFGLLTESPGSLVLHCFGLVSEFFIKPDVPFRSYVPPAGFLSFLYGNLAVYYLDPPGFFSTSVRACPGGECGGSLELRSRKQKIRDS